MDENGLVRSAGAGLAPAVRELPGGAAIARLLQRHPDGAERLYWFFASRRSRFGRLIPGALKGRADDLIRRRA